MTFVDIVESPLFILNMSAGVSPCLSFLCLACSLLQENRKSHRKSDDFIVTFFNFAKYTIRQKICQPAAQ
jgi:hypothetical protein